MTALSRTPLAPSDVHFAISQQALLTLSDRCDGNGVKAQQIRLVRHNTVVHQFSGAIRVELRPEIIKSTVKGKAPHGQVLDLTDAVLGQSAAQIRILLDRQGAARQEILDAVQKIPGAGFGMDPLVLALRTAKKEFSVVDKCLKCDGVSFLACNRCNATGSISCVVCNEQGFVACQACAASGRIQQADGNNLSCPRCQGSGRIQCVTCRGQRQMSCPICRGLCKIGCMECDQSGFLTHVYQIIYKAECAFEIDRLSCPATVQEVIDRLGTKQLATEGHAEIFWQPAELRLEHLYIPFNALFPIAEAEFSIEGKSCPARVAGLQGRIVQIEPVLDLLIKPGISALQGLSKGPMASQALIETACKYKIIRQTIGGLTRRPKKSVYQKLMRDYPLVLSEKYANAAVRYADIALLTIGAAPRNKGLVAGTVLAALLAAGYYLAPLRNTILMVMLQHHIGRHILLVDFLMWLLGWAATVFIIKSMAARSFGRLLPDSIQTDKGGLPAAGSQGVWALFTTAIIWIAIAVLAAKPEWMTPILKVLATVH